MRVPRGDGYIIPLGEGIILLLGDGIMLLLGEGIKALFGDGIIIDYVNGILNAWNVFYHTVLMFVEKFVRALDLGLIEMNNLSLSTSTYLNIKI